MSDDNNIVEIVVEDGLSEEFGKAEVVLFETDTNAIVIAAANCGSVDTSTTLEDDDENKDDDEEIRSNKKPKVVLVEIAAYVNIVPPARTPKAKEVTVTCGPFLFTAETTYDIFLQGIVSCASNGQPHSTTSINQSQLYWKFNVPLNDKKKPLSTIIGYQALVSSVKTRLQDSKGKSKDNSITLTMPPLSKKVNKAVRTLYNVSNYFSACEYQ